MANYPEPTYGTAVVDGLINEWDLVNDFFANMYNGGNNNGRFELTSKAYLRYDGCTNTLYVLVLQYDNIPVLISPSDAWVAIDTINNKVTFTNFAWVGVGYDGNPTHAQGYEASFQIAPGNYTIAIHAEVLFNGATATSATSSAPQNWFIPLTLRPVCIRPSINIVKYISVDGGNTWLDANNPPFPQVLVGNPVQYKLVVTNSGNVALDNVTISDPVLGINTNIGTLPAGNSSTITTGPIPALSGPHTNTATATGSYNGQQYTAHDDAGYYGANPAIDLVKFVSVDGGLTWIDANTPPYPQVLVGNNVLYKYVVTNIGNVTLNNVTIFDPIVGINKNIGPLSVGAKYSLTSDPIPAIAGNQINIATATGYFNYNGMNLPYTDNDTATYFGANPSISIIKYLSVDGGTTWFDANTPPFPQALVGSDVLYRFEVINNGNVDLNNVTVFDPILGIDKNIGSLAVGALYPLNAGPISAIAGLQTNKATVTGYFSYNGMNLPYSTSDSATYFGANPSIDIVKYISVDGGVTWLDANTPPFPQVLVGSALQYKFVVTNTGNVDLDNVTITDPVLGFTINIGTLAAGNQYTFTSNDIPIYITAGSGNQTNTTTATGYFNYNGTPLPYSDSDTATYFGANPSIDIVKYISVDYGMTWLDANTPPYPQVLVGSTVQYKFVITNTGNVALDNVTVTDPVLGITQNIGTLAPGAVYTIPSNNIPISFIAAYGTHTNTATVTGYFNYNGSNLPYTDSDTASYFGTLVTYTKGGYAGGGVPGTILTNNFSKFFLPGGLMVGKYNSPPAHGLLWTNVNSLKMFLTTGGPSGALTKDALNPTSSTNNGGTLATQVATLILNVTFSGNVPGMPAGLGNLIYVNPNDSLSGLTVNQILTAANNALATGVLPQGYSFGSLNTLITQINQAFDNGIATTWAQQHLF